MRLDPSYLVASLLVSGVGFVLFKYGRSQRRLPHAAFGVLMLVYPYFVTDIALMLLIMALLCVVLWVLVRLGA